MTSPQEFEEGIQVDVQNEFECGTVLLSYRDAKRLGEYLLGVTANA
jgi:hypothetical protein